MQFRNIFRLSDCIFAIYWNGDHLTPVFLLGLRARNIVLIRKEDPRLVGRERNTCGDGRTGDGSRRSGESVLDGEVGYRPKCM